MASKANAIRSIDICKTRAAAMAAAPRKTDFKSIRTLRQQAEGDEEVDEISEGLREYREKKAAK